MGRSAHAEDRREWGNRPAAQEPQIDPPRQRILNAASERFYRDGIRAVGVDAIIAAAGVAKASFYRHFHSKEELVVEWLRSDQARWLERVRAETERRASTPDERLLVFFDVVAEWVASPDFAGCPYLSTAVELRDPNGPPRAVIVEFLSDVERYLTSLAAAAGLGHPEQVGVELRLLCGGFLIAPVATGELTIHGQAARVAARAIVDAAR
jgi:AcrR family transcriptional regulator